MIIAKTHSCMLGRNAESSVRHYPSKLLCYNQSRVTHHHHSLFLTTQKCYTSAISMQLRPIKPSTLEQFVAQHPLGSFVQSAANAKRVAQLGWQPHYLGLFAEGGRLVATAVLYEWRTLGYSEFECLQGPLVDYHNSAVLSTLLTELKKYVKTHKGILLRLQPPLILRQGSDPTQLLEVAGTAKALQQFTQTGFRAIPPQQTDRNARYVRWFFVKDLSPYHDDAALLKSFDAKTRSCVKAATKYGVAVREITAVDDLAPFAKLLIDTGTRRGFSGRNEAFYQQLFRAFHRTQAWFLIAELDLAGYQARLSAQQDTLQAERDALATEPDKQGQVKELDNQLTAISKRLADYETLRQAASGDVLPLAAAIFMHTSDNEVVYFLSGSDDQHAKFSGSYALQYTAMRRAISLGAQRYNFYGTSGNFNGFPEQEGVYHFKKGFGGQLEERAGCYEYIARPFIHQVVRFMRAARKIIAR